MPKQFLSGSVIPVRQINQRSSSTTATSVQTLPLQASSLQRRADYATNHVFQVNRLAVLVLEEPAFSRVAALLTPQLKWNANLIDQWQSCLGFGRLAGAHDATDDSTADMHRVRIKISPFHGSYFTGAQTKEEAQHHH